MENVISKSTKFEFDGTIFSLKSVELYADKDSEGEIEWSANFWIEDEKGRELCLVYCEYGDDYYCAGFNISSQQFRNYGKNPDKYVDIYMGDEDDFILEQLEQIEIGMSLDDVLEAAKESVKDELDDEDDDDFHQEWSFEADEKENYADKNMKIFLEAREMKMRELLQANACS